MIPFKGDNLIAKSRSANHAGLRRRRAAVTAAALTLPLTISGIALAAAWLPVGGATAATIKLTEVPRSVKVAQQHADHAAWHRAATGGSPSAPATQPSTPAPQPSTPGTGGSGQGGSPSAGDGDENGSPPAGDGDENGHQGNYGGGWQGGLPSGWCASCDHGWGGSGGNSWDGSGGNNWGGYGDHGWCGSCGHGWGWSNSSLAVSVIHEGWFRSYAAGAYLVSLLNTGAAPAQGVSVDIDLAPGVVPLRVYSARWRCFVNLDRGREICWYQGLLQPGLRAVLALPERVDAAPGGYLVGLARTGSGSGHRVSVDIGVARRLVPVCVSGYRSGGCSVHLPRPGRICSCRDLRPPWPAGDSGWRRPPWLPGIYHPDGYLVSLPGADAGYGQQVFADGDLARGWAAGCGQRDGSPCGSGSSQGGGLCSCHGLLLPQLHTTVLLPDHDAAPDGSFPVVRPDDGPAAGVSPDGQVIDVTRIQPAS